MYGDFLEAHGDDYAQIFFTDIRDVVFQEDVFETFKEHSSYLGYVTGFLKIGEERKYNYAWVEGRFGKEAAEKIADKKLSARELLWERFK